jgi:hypothetical protein
MVDTARISDILVALGPRLGVGEIFASEAPGTWTLAFDAARVLFLDLDQHRGVLVLSCDLQPVPEARRAALHDLFLQTGALWKHTGGSRIALSPQGGAPVLIQEVGLGPVDERFLGTMIEQFRERAAGWNALIATDPQDRQAAIADISSFMIRI